MNHIIRIAAALLTLAPAALTAEPVTTHAELMPADTLWACYVPGSGTVYRIRTADTPQECTKDKHVTFSWETGFEGGPGRILSQVRRESAPISLKGPGDRQSGSVQCNFAENEVAIGGGISILGGGTRAYLIHDMPGADYDGVVRSWYGSVETPPDVYPNAGYGFKVYVLCAKLST